MKRIIAIIFVLLLLTSAGFAQQTDNKRKLEDAKRKAADERSRGFGARRTHNDFDKSKHGVNEENAASNELKNNEVAGNKSDKSGTTQPGGKSSERSSQLKNDQNQSKDNREKSTDANNSNATSVIQATTSESGSPAILSDNNGSSRDGTNNVQRGTTKMAGAEVTGDMGLYKKDNSERNIQTPKRIRKQEEQPARITGRPTSPQNQEDATVQAESKPQGETAVTKEPAKKETKKQRGKSKKSKRNKDRDSGK